MEIKRWASDILDKVKNYLSNFKAKETKEITHCPHCDSDEIEIIDGTAYCKYCKRVL